MFGDDDDDESETESGNAVAVPPRKAERKSTADAVYQTENDKVLSSDISSLSKSLRKPF